MQPGGLRSQVRRFESFWGTLYAFDQLVCCFSLLRPVREITGVPVEMIGFFSRRRAAIEAAYVELARGYRDEHGHDPDQAARQRLARQANLATGVRPQWNGHGR